MPGRGGSRRSRSRWTTAPGRRRASGTRSPRPRGPSGGPTSRSPPASTSSPCAAWTARGTRRAWSAGPPIPAGRAVYMARPQTCRPDQPFTASFVIHVRGRRGDPPDHKRSCKDLTVGVTAMPRGEKNMLPRHSDFSYPKSLYSAQNTHLGTRTAREGHGGNRMHVQRTLWQAAVPLALLLAAASLPVAAATKTIDLDAQATNGAESKCDLNV